MSTLVARLTWLDDVWRDLDPAFATLIDRSVEENEGDSMIHDLTGLDQNGDLSVLCCTLQYYNQQPELWEVVSKNFLLKLAQVGYWNNELGGMSSRQMQYLFLMNPDKIKNYFQPIAWDGKEITFPDDDAVFDALQKDSNDGDHLRWLLWNTNYYNINSVIGLLQQPSFVSLALRVGESALPDFVRSRLRYPGADLLEQGAIIDEVKFSNFPSGPLALAENLGGAEIIYRVPSLHVPVPHHNLPLIQKEIGKLLHCGSDYADVARCPEMVRNFICNQSISRRSLMDNEDGILEMYEIAGEAFEDCLALVTRALHKQVGGCISHLPFEVQMKLGAYTVRREKLEYLQGNVQSLLQLHASSQGVPGMLHYTDAMDKKRNIKLWDMVSAVFPYAVKKETLPISVHTSIVSCAAANIFSTSSDWVNKRIDTDPTLKTIAVFPGPGEYYGLKGQRFNSWNIFGSLDYAVFFEMDDGYVVTEHESVSFRRDQQGLSKTNLRRYMDVPHLLWFSLLQYAQDQGKRWVGMVKASYWVDELAKIKDIARVTNESGEADFEVADLGIVGKEFLMYRSGGQMFPIDLRAWPDQLPSLTKEAANRFYDKLALGTPGVEEANIVYRGKPLTIWKVPVEDTPLTPFLRREAVEGLLRLAP